MGLASCTDFLGISRYKLKQSDGWLQLGRLYKKCWMCLGGVHRSKGLSLIPKLAGCWRREIIALQSAQLCEDPQLTGVFKEIRIERWYEGEMIDLVPSSLLQ